MKVEIITEVTTLRAEKNIDILKDYVNLLRKHHINRFTENIFLAGGEVSVTEIIDNVRYNSKYRIVENEHEDTTKEGKETGEALPLL